MISDSGGPSLPSNDGKTIALVSCKICGKSFTRHGINIHIARSHRHSQDLIDIDKPTDSILSETVNFSPSDPIECQDNIHLNTNSSNNEKVIRAVNNDEKDKSDNCV